ncbi:MAG TPA: GNAT family N-acetyltransferase [Bacteroidales bacterium]
MIDFKTIDNFKPGLIQNLLKKSYAGLIECFPDDKEKFYKQWEQEDNNVFNNPNTIGKCVLFACLEGLPIGYCSWDDRQNPIGIVGQNCILPEYQRQGFGSRQIELMIEIFKGRKFTEITVITGDHEFFKPAQRLYEKCGFMERQRFNGDLFKRIELYKLL